MESCAELADYAAPAGIQVLLENHGAVTMGSSLEEAQIRMESLEHSAKIIFTARLLGKVNPLHPRDVARLEDLRRARQAPGAYPGCPMPQEEH